MMRPALALAATISALVLVPAANALAAGTPTLTNLLPNQVDDVFKVFGADLAFKPVEPPSSYGKIFGLSAGVIGGITSAQPIKDSIPGTTIDYVPAANIFLGVQLPYGWGVEFGFLPQTTISSAQLRSFGGDLKWTISDALFTTASPISFAVRAMYSGTKLNFSQNVSGIEDTVSFKSSSVGANLSAGLKFGFFEPYVGAGFIHQSSTLSNSGSITLFDSSVSLTSSLDEKNGSGWFYAGFQMTFIALTISAEYDSLFGVSSELFKLGLKI
jgi:hypothetical protein